MEIKKIKQKIISKLDIKSEVYKDNYSEMMKKLSEIEDLLDLAEMGG